MVCFRCRCRSRHRRAGGRSDLCPAAFLEGLPGGRYDWSDLNRLVRRDQLITSDEIVQDVQQGYAFLRELTEEEALLAADPYEREYQIYRWLADSLKNTQLSLR